MTSRHAWEARPGMRIHVLDQGTELTHGEGAFERRWGLTQHGRPVLGGRREARGRPSEPPADRGGARLVRCESNEPGRPTSRSSAGTSRPGPPAQTRHWTRRAPRRQTIQPVSQIVVGEGATTDVSCADAQNASGSSARSSLNATSSVQPSESVQQVLGVHRRGDPQPSAARANAGQRNTDEIPPVPRADRTRDDLSGPGRPQVGDRPCGSQFHLLRDLLGGRVEGRPGRSPERRAHC